MPLPDRITFDPSVMGGKPCLRGLRVTASTFVGLVATGYDSRAILAAYPPLEAEDIQAALPLGASKKPSPHAAGKRIGHGELPRDCTPQNTDATMPDTITPELAEKYTRQIVAIDRITGPLALVLSFYGLWVDVRRWQHNAGNSYALDFALHAVVCVLWVALFLVVIVGKKIFSRSYRPPYDPHQHDLFSSFTARKALVQLLYYASYWATFWAFLHGGRLHQNNASFIYGEMLFAMAGTLTLTILAARRILRKHKQAHNG